MRIVAVLFLVAMFMSPGCTSTNNNDFEPIFNNRTLSEWKPYQSASGGTWEVVDSSIVGSIASEQEGGFLSTGRTYENFLLDFEVMIDWGAESSVLLRAGPEGKAHQLILNYKPGGEIGALHKHPSQTIMTHAPDDYICGNTPEKTRFFRQYGWNRVRIKINGEPALIQFWLNNKLVTDYLHSEKSTGGIPKEGTICLQIQNGMEKSNENEKSTKKKIRFRNLRVKEM